MKFNISNISDLSLFCKMECCCLWYVGSALALILLISYVLFKKAFCSNITADISGKHVLVSVLTSYIYTIV